MNVYITADVVGRADHGAGSVTWNERAALRELGPTATWDRLALEQAARGDEPWRWDKAALFVTRYDGMVPLTGRPQKLRLAHFYAGTFSETAEEVQRQGARVTYTAAAHDVAASRRAHEEMGFVYNYPHLTDPALWERYLAGYKASDVLICPSTHSAVVMRGFGCINRIEVIPHGVNLPEPEKLKPMPPLPFTVGYLGNCAAPDKGLVHLLRAWKSLGWKDAKLVLAGHDSGSAYVQSLWQRQGGGNVEFRGWVDNVADFYADIHLYVQPSVTEGFGLEVLESMAHARPVLCSEGAGAVDLVPMEWRFMPADSNALATALDVGRALVEDQMRNWLSDGALRWLSIAENHTWHKVKQRYVSTWRELMGGKL